MKKHKFIFGLAAILLSVVLIGCGTPAPVETGKVLRIMYGEPSTLDPQQANDTVSGRYVVEVYSGLLTLVPVANTVFDQYAEERELPVLTEGIVEKMPAVWQEWVRKNYFDKGVTVVLSSDIAEAIPEPVVNPDGTVSYTFKIRENARFHNGKKVTAEDFKFSFNRAANPIGPDAASPYTLPTCDLYLSDIVGVKDMMYGRGKVKEISGVEVLDEQTLRITIDAMKTYFLWKLTYPTAFVIDKDKIVHPRTGEPLNIDWTSHPNGTGPFKLVEKNDKQIILEKNKDFYLDPPLIDKVIFNLEGGEAEAFYRDGRIDMIGIGVEQLSFLDELEGEYFEGPIFGVYYIGFNMGQPPFDDINLRKAFALSIDMETLIHKKFKDLMAPPQGILPPGIPGYREDYPGISYDPEKAREFLRASRYWDEKTQSIVVNGEKLRIELTFSGQGPSPGDVTSAVLDMWRQNLGIEVYSQKPLGFKAFQDKLKLGNYMMSIHGWVADYPDPEDFLDLMFHSEKRVENRTTRYSNPEVDRLLNLARVEQNQAKRWELYQQAEDIIMEELPWAPLLYDRQSIMVSPRVKGYYPLPMVIPFFRYIDIVI